MATSTETVTVTESVEYVDRSLPTASAWIKYEILPGEYEVVYHFSYRKVRVLARQIESYYVNRLFTASSVNHDTEVKEPEYITVPAFVVEGISA